MLAAGAVLCAMGAASAAAGQPPAPYDAVEVDSFFAPEGIAFPANHQSALVEDIARELSVEFPTLAIVRQGDPTPYGHAILRIFGVVAEFKSGRRAKGGFLPFGTGATVRAQVRFSDAVTGQVFLVREIKGSTWAGGDSQAAGDSLARKIVKVCNSAHLVESH
jgi:hypothetical protein